MKRTVIVTLSLGLAIFALSLGLLLVVERAAYAGPTRTLSRLSDLDQHVDDARPSVNSRRSSSLTIFTVTSAADSGPGTLRQALLDALNGDTITFDPAVFLPTSPVTIALTSALPAITQGNLTVDASNARVIVDGSGTPDNTNGLEITSSGNTIKGLQILHFPENGIVIKDGAQNNTIGGSRAVGSGPTGEGNVLSGHGGDNGIEIRDSTTMSNTVIGNLIGTNATGTQAVPNTGPGIFIWLGANRNRIEGNVISGNGGDGIGISGSSTDYNTIIGNLIGTNANGTAAILNDGNGVYIGNGASYNLIGGINASPGGACTGECNLISGSGWDGVSINGGDTMSNTVSGNYIGTDVSGTFPLGNGGDGVRMEDGTRYNVIGGDSPEERNVVSGNSFSGVSMGGGATENIVSGNYIGTDASGMAALGNGQDSPQAGVALYGDAHHNRIGGSSSAERNVISGNHAVGVAINLGLDTDYNVVVGNYIGTDATGTGALGNTFAGVYIADDASDNIIGGSAVSEANVIAHNDVYGVYVRGTSTLSNTISHNSIYSNTGLGIDLRSGANDNIVSPVVTSFNSATGDASGTACANCTIEVFSDDDDEGRWYEGTTTADGAGTWSLTKGSAFTGSNVHATATDADGNTSEFSGPPPVVSSVLPTSAAPGTSDLGVTISGNHFRDNEPLVVDFGAGVTVTSTQFISRAQIKAYLDVDSSAVLGPRDVAVTNYDGQSGTATGAFTVTATSPFPSPVINSITPTIGLQGKQMDLTVYGQNFVDRPTVTFSGEDITINAVTVVSATELLVNIATSDAAPADLHDLTITNPDGQGYTLTGAFEVEVRLFTDVSYWAGIGTSGQRGVAWGDYNSDGYVDLFVTNNNVLYHNNGDGTFTDATAIAGGLWWGGEGVIWGDYDNDGDLDLYTSDWGNGDSLYRNEGDGTFTNVTDQADLSDPGHGQSVAWGDYDGDGDLDLYVTNNEGDPNYLFRNESDGTFSDVTAQAQVADTGDGRGVAWGDYDNDGDPDLYVTNEPGTNRLFQNQGDGTFVDRAAELGVTAAAYGGGTGAAWGDYDNDGDLDLAISAGGTAVLYRNDGNAFADVGSAGIGGQGVAWGDYDNDGWLDLYVTSDEGSALYHNNGDGTFAEVTDAAGVDSGPGNWGTAWGDYDNDGDLDLFVVKGGLPELGEPDLQDILYRNNGNSNHWLHVRSVGTVSNRAGIGARVRVIAGGLSQIREVSGGSGRTSQDSLPVEFGLGDYTGTVTVEVTWPSGILQSLHNVTLNQILTVTEAGTLRVVTSTADSGPGTLRQALLDAQAGDTITFDPAVFPPTSPVTIALTSALPEITQGNLTIDASDAGVILDGSTITDPNTDGLIVRSSGNVIRGLQILNFPRIGINLTMGADNNVIGGDATVGAGPSGQGNVIGGNGDAGIYIGGGHNNVIVGNRIGTDASGMAAVGNNAGVLLREGAQGNQIGGTTAGERNVIAANSTTGVQIMDAGTAYNVVIGNFIGTNILGASSIGNTYGGVWIMAGAHENRVGGTTVGETNLISGNSGDGVRITDTGTISNTVTGNYIGTDASGTVALGNDVHGVLIGDGAQGNIVGGTTPQERNIISGNGNTGVGIWGSGTMSNTISGNYIGTDVSGTAAITNTYNGVAISGGAQYNVVGGTSEGERNIISASGNGVHIGDAGTTDNVVIGNYIGTDATGTKALGHYWNGAQIRDGAQRNRIGGTTPNERNVISGNENGVQIGGGPGTDENLIIGNYIGIDATGSAALGNRFNGVYIWEGSQRNCVEANVISSNSTGIWIFDTDTLGNTITQNSIYGNDGQGIDLAAGGNMELPAPVITSMDLGAGTVAGTACASCTIEVFSDDEDEGRVYEGTTAADANGDWTFTKGSPLIGPHVTATATDPQGNTSEFSMVPFMRVNRSHDWVDGQIPLPNTEVEAAVIDPEGNIKGTGSAFSNDGGWFWTDVYDANDDRVNIVPGDVVSVTIGAGLVITAEVVSMTGNVDVAADTMAGNIPDASEGQQVRAEIWDLPHWPGDVEGTVQADGSYALHFEDFDIRDGHRVVVWYRNDHGNFMGIVRHWLRIETQSGGSAVWGQTIPNATVQTTVASDGIKGTGTDSEGDEEGNYWTEIYSDTQPVTIMPEDTITVTADGRATAMTVETLTGVMDYDTDAVCGIAPPNSEVRVDIWGEFDDWYNVDASGHYCAEFDFDLQSGYQGEVAFFDERGHRIESLLTYREREVTPLSLGGPLEDSVESLVYKDYVLEIDAGERLLIEVTPLDGIGQIWLYGRLNDVPSRAQYDFRTTRPTTSGTYELLVSPTRQGTYYFSVLGWDITAQQGTYTIVARTVADRYLADVQPRSAGNTGDVTLNVQGFGFVEGMGMELRRSGYPTLVADGVMQSSSTAMSAHFDLTGVDPGIYDAVAIWPDGAQETLEGAFEVLTGGVGSRLEASLEAPEFVRPGRTFVLWLDYANTGDADMVAPLFIISSPDGAPMRLADQEPFEDRAAQILGVNSEGLAGNLPPGASGRIPIYFQVPPGTAGHEMVDFDLAIMVSDTLSIDWNEVEDEVRPPDVNPEVWDVLWPSLTAQIGDTWGDYRKTLADNASYLSSLGRTVYSVRELFRFEVRKALGMNPRTVLAGRLDAHAPAPGMPLQFGRVFPGSLEGRFYLGPLGRGWSHSYDIYLEEQSDGDVLMHWPGSFTRLFASNGDGTYTALPGDYGTLTRDGDIFELTEKDGTVYRFRADGKLDYIEDPNGNRITAVYDGGGRLIEIRHSNGDSFTLEYNAHGRISRLTDHAGRVTQYSYDATGEHLLTVTAPGNRVTTYTYNSPGGQPTDHALLSIAYPDGTHQYYAYEGLGRLSEEQLDGGAERISYTYDAFDRIHVTDATGETAIISPDEHGRPAKVRDALGSELGQEHSPEFNLSRLTDPAGQPYEFHYDLLGNVIATENPLGHRVKLGYDTRFSKIASLEDARGNRSTFEYNDSGNLTTLTYPDGGHEIFAYDAAGNPTSYTSRSGDEITYTYNARGQLLRKDFPDGSWIAYTYDAAGNMISASDANGTITMEYDADTNLLTRITYPSGHSFAYSYNDAGRRTQRMSDDGYTLNYHYDAVGRLERLTDGTGAEIIRYEYDDVGRLSRESGGNGTYTTYEYDAAGQLLSMVNYAPDDTVQSRFDYTYDVNGNRKTMTTLAGTTTYEYDLIGQLIGVTYPDGRRVTYEYDAAGNRITVTDDGTSTDYTTNEMNQYSQVGAATYTYDANGNMTSKTDADGTTTYEYDAENRLVRVATPTGDIWEYTYDALGNRVAVEHNGVLTRYVHDPIGLVDVAAEYDGSGALMARYIHGLGLVARFGAAGSSAYYAYDATGHTRQLTDDTGAVANTYDYTPFGIPLQVDETIPNPFRYVGRFGVMMEEGIGLQYMRARSYDPRLGRFVSMDPIRSSWQGLYRYGDNNPVIFVDPSGLQVALDIGTQFVDPFGLQVSPDSVTPWQVGPDFTTPWWELAFGPPWPDPNNPGRPPYKRPLKTWELTDIEHPGVLSDMTEPIGTGTAENITAIDPNEKVGPAGYGEQRLVSVNDELHYVVYFENMPEAGAPAQEVFVTDYLDSDLDWSTFRLVEIAWGDHIISVPENTAGFYTRQTVEDYREDVEKSWWVDVQVALNYTTGRVRWIFRTLDPDTGELPEDVFAGFLPPNDETGRGEGHMAFTIRPRSDALNGSVITNKASIVFDVNEPIITNEVSNTLCALTADFDADLDVDVVDIMEVVRRWGAKEGDVLYEVKYDLHRDGIIDTIDIQQAATQWRQSC